MVGAVDGAKAAPPRILVVCCDGTWNDPNSNTNVWRTFCFLRSAGDLTCENPDEVADTVECMGQLAEKLDDGSSVTHPIVARYERGVGEAKGGGAFGVGLGEKVRSAYAFIVRNWEPGARIFVFGFSRGAYTARSLSGLLNVAGVVKDQPDALDAAWAYYRMPSAERTIDHRSQLEAHQQPGAALHTPVRFLGVWDTVGSLGVPVLSLRRAFDRLWGEQYRFHNTGLGRNVIHAYQALAIHEQRGAFKPVLWTRRYKTVLDEKGQPTPQHMLQVWFTGSHADVGGGYRGDSGLADLSLDWMLRRAVQSGLPLTTQAWLGPGNAPASAKCEPSPFAARNVSSSWLWRTIAGQNPGLVDFILDRLPVVVRVPLSGLRQALRVPDVVRAIGGESPTDDGHFVVGLGERLHESVIRRYRGDHVPANVKAALTADLPVFHERDDARTPCNVGTRVTIDEDDAILLDRSRGGIGVGEVGWLQPDTRCKVAFDGERWGARVAWTNGDRAGLALMYKLRRPEGRPAQLA